MSTTAWCCGTRPTSWGSSAGPWSRVSASSPLRSPQDAAHRRAPPPRSLGFLTLPLPPDRYVIYGNHRDSWVHGAVDPSSGTSVLLEISRVLGTLLKKGEAVSFPWIRNFIPWRSPPAHCALRLWASCLTSSLSFSRATCAKLEGPGGRRAWASALALLEQASVVQGTRAIPSEGLLCPPMKRGQMGPQARQCPDGPKEVSVQLGRGWQLLTSMSPMPTVCQASSKHWTSPSEHQSSCCNDNSETRNKEKRTGLAVKTAVPGGEWNSDGRQSMWEGAAGSGGRAVYFLKIRTLLEFPCGAVG